MREKLALLLAVACTLFAVLLAALYAWRGEEPTRAPTAEARLAADAHDGRRGPGAQDARGARDTRDPPPPTDTVAAARVPPPVPTLARGREVFTAAGCAACHSLQGTGNPRSPLDGVARRLDRSALRDWTLAEGAAAGDLPPRARNAKRESRALPEADVEALLDLLESSR